MSRFDDGGMGAIVKKNIFLRRVLTLLIGTVILYGILNTIIFVLIANGMFTDLQIRELEPRAEAIANLVLKYQQGGMTKSELNEQFSINNEIWNAAVYVYDGQGNLMIRSEGTLIRRFEKELRQHMTPALNKAFGRYLDSVLSGQQIVSTKGPFLVVGQPILDNGTVSGAVFLSKPPAELVTAFLGLNRSMQVSALGVLLLMIFPVYRVTRHIVNPLKEMRDVAINMANGNLTEQANEAYKGEIGELGRSLNYLSSRLSKTISALEVERNRLKQTIDGLSEGIVAIDTEGNITHVNPAIHSIFGMSQEDGRKGIIPSQELWEDFETVLLRGYTIVRSMQWKQMVLRITICPLEDELNHIAGAVGLFRDVTESERLEQTRREYVANVSHELRTPVSALRALSETLADDMVPDEDTKKRYYSHMLHETMRLTRLINDLLTLSRLQSDPAAIQREEFKINELMTNVADRYAVLAGEKGIEFSFSALPEDVMINSNMDLVEQVLIILLDNAIKYTSSQGNILLDVSSDDNIVKIFVSDTGIGISPSDLPHIFERFYKVDKAHATQGTGLGLAIAFEIIQRLGEEIYVESQLEKGSTFTFTLSRNSGVRS
ncbi:two-component system sensor histidine kinase ResE [Anaerosolibacter carboniphilus]|uniref:histidine kinase n=1 Tax=Anaerosolibacter carboniphilus TaxID=1417629 RepID=A0A841L7P4_9FIRM|nr:ATP-binding protein [Anaerosolibacter carboniphilus]MBB6218285.1 two-component system sensor histidine kinase ResE [Anaerosolibacter carboniphilus]